MSEDAAWKALSHKCPHKAEFRLIGRHPVAFASLVEASALDIHCFVVQVNNRTYGDCRIRAPYAEQYQRDVVRVKGGEMDYFVIGKLDVPGLRAFQSHFRSPAGGSYKPVPDGFEPAPDRGVRPSSK